jgi:glyoxylase-like metal-dependent hydrolase (beta-lactamase superfamily II)
MHKYKILIQGYVRKKNNELYTAPATVLISGKRKKILVDPGSNIELLIKALKKEKIKKGDIDLIYLTHGHLDHLINIRYFPETDIASGFSIYRKDRIMPFKEKIPGTDITVHLTPGHCMEHYSLSFPTDNGTVVVAGDLFWWNDDEQQLTDHANLLYHKDIYVEDIKSLFESRKNILAIADHIIPGHGKMFRVRN